MVDLSMRTTSPYSQTTIATINITMQYTMTTQNIISLNSPNHNTNCIDVDSAPTVESPPSKQRIPEVRTIEIPRLENQIQKGQKFLLDPTGTVQRINVCLGWNVLNPQCDIDVSAFILGTDNKVLGDDWFVFYGQEDSPDKTVHFSLSEETDREYISVDLAGLNSNVHKIVFVLTINDALKNNLNFSMVKDAYIRILNADNQQELVSFQMTDYYDNVISMMIGEIYLHAGNWKCNAIGNGVAKDLAGLCELYGVQVV